MWEDTLILLPTDVQYDSDQAVFRSLVLDTQQLCGKVST
jgi:hypothetical protein